MSEYSLFTSESVSEGHPDKMADQISDAILDAYLSKDPDARVAVETLVKTGMVVVAGEVTTAANVTPGELEAVIRQTVLDIGFDSSRCASMAIPARSLMRLDNSRRISP